MQKVNLIFWILLTIYLCILVYAELFFSPGQKKSATDLSKKSLQTLLTRVKEKIPYETSISLAKFQGEIVPEEYEGAKKRNLFARYEVLKKELPKIEEGTPAKEEKPPQPVFIYKGTMVMGTKKVIILQEQEANRSFFIGKGERFNMESEGVAYELVDVTEDKVILLKLGQEPQEVVIPKKTP